MKRSRWLLGLGVPGVLASSAIGYTAVTRADIPPAMPSEAPAAPQAADGFEWFFILSGPVSGDAGDDMAIDDEGNVFIAGHHGGLDTDQDGELDLLAGDPWEPLFLKMSQHANGERVVLEWMRSPASPGVNTGGQTIAPDWRGGAYGGGRFRETISFGPNLSLTSAGHSDGFLVRYGADGDVLWAKALGGAGADALFDVGSDRAGNVYVVGSGTGPFVLDDGTEFRVPEGSTWSFIASYDPEGAIRWSRVVTQTNASTIQVAPDGEVIVTGAAEGAVDFDGDGRADLPAPSDRDGFVARFDADGGFIGAWWVGAGAGKFAFASDGDLLLLGAVGGPMGDYFGVPDFDGDGVADVALKGGGPMSAWVARYTRDGTLKWVRSYTMERAYDLVTDGERIVMTGSYHGVRDLDEDGEPEKVDRTVDPSLESELAILILSEEDGRPERVWIAPGPGNDIAKAAAFLPGRPILYVTGQFQLTADFSGDGADGEGWIQCHALGDLFFARYRLGERRAISLSTVGTEVSGVGLRADLTWSGATSASVDVYRNGNLLASTANDGAYTDSIPRGTRGPFSYRVCEAGAQTCSNTSTPQF